MGLFSAVELRIGGRGLASFRHALVASWLWLGSRSFSPLWFPLYRACADFYASSDVAEGIYGRFVGAELNIVQGVGYVWVLPCSFEVNATFKFGGKDFPMHPLDMTM